MEDDSPSPPLKEEASALAPQLPTLGHTLGLHPPTNWGEYSVWTVLLSVSALSSS